MPDQVPFSAEKRTITGKAVKRLRKHGIVPGNIFGGGQESEAIQMSAHDIQRFLATHTPTTVLRLGLDDGGSARNVIVAHVQHQPATHQIQHVDFLQVNLNQPIKAKVPIRVVGEAPAMKIGGAMMLHLLEAVDVEARPVDLPASLELDVSGLEELKSALHVSDLRVPASVTVLTDAGEPVLKIEPSKLSFAEEEVVASESDVPAHPAEMETPEE
ncbi:MAG TPA: 50S ribosomal protein L25 [Ktedonobacterales bacterium]